MIGVYVAGASREIERARRFIAMVERHPAMKITHDWVADFDDAAKSGLTDADMPDDLRLAHSQADLNGVAEAEVLIALADGHGLEPSRGMWVELGYAIAVREAEAELAEPVHRIIVSHGDRRCIFSVAGMVDVEADTDGEAWATLKSWVEIDS